MPVRDHVDAVNDPLPGIFEVRVAPGLDVVEVLLLMVSEGFLEPGPDSLLRFLRLGRIKFLLVLDELLGR